MSALAKIGKRMVRGVVNGLARPLIQGLPLDRILTTETYIRLAYRLILGRRPDAEGFRHFQTHLSGQRIPKAAVFEALVTSPEYRKKEDPFNYARLQLIKRLPRADVIVDLGGSSKHASAGALYAMGYCQQWRRLIIVDLPPQERHAEWRKERAEVPRVVTDYGPVEYRCGSMADPALFAEAEFADLVWSGNSIEHVTEQEADQVLENVYKILKPGGLFCLDTPNRRVTRLHYLDTYSHPDHKIEYTDELLSAKLQQHGFSIVEKFGVLDCRRMLAGEPLTPETLRHCPDFCPDPRDGYFLYYRCAKPPAPAATA